MSSIRSRNDGKRRQRKKKKRIRAARARAWMGRGPKTKKKTCFPLTCHGGIDTSNVGEQSQLCKLDTERRRVVHFSLQHFGTSVRAVESRDV